METPEVAKARKALKCLYAQVPSEVAYDVSRLVEAAFESLAGGEGSRCDQRLCKEPPAWVRKTQFAGNHYFCDRHARAEGNFGEEDPSYFFWRKLGSER